MKTLIVTSPFGGHAAGHAITDPYEVRAILEGEHAQHVVASDTPDPEPAPKAKKPAPQE